MSISVHDVPKPWNYRFTYHALGASRAPHIVLSTLPRVVQPADSQVADNEVIQQTIHQGDREYIHREAQALKGVALRRIDPQGRSVQRVHPT